MEYKTISHLNSKVWYRFLKVIFIAALFIVLLFWNVIFGYASSDFNFNDIIIGNLIILFVFETARRSFYYIALGTIRPEK